VEQASLFPNLALPTTRDIARLAKEGGVDAVGGTRRADDATYREIRCRSALNRVRGMPFKWTLNPYRGCTHGCHYCFARRYQAHLELDAGDQFASLIFIKTNVVERLRAELDRPDWKREQVALGTATDPYQPIEGTYRLTRGALECFARAATPVGLVTKGPMVLRDRDVLSDLGARAECRVYLSIPTVDEDAWRRLEPGTAHPLQRLRAVRELVDADIDAGVLMAPIVPGLTSQPAKLERTVRAIADSGARHVGAMVMHLEGGTRDHFMRFLAREYPELAEQYGHLYAGKYAPKPYLQRVQDVVGILKARYGVPLGKATGRRQKAGEDSVDSSTRASV
jgi:DNA repair photolyase